MRFRYDAPQETCVASQYINTHHISLRNPFSLHAFRSDKRPKTSRIPVDANESDILKQVIREWKTNSFPLSTLPSFIFTKLTLFRFNKTNRTFSHFVCINKKNLSVFFSFFCSIFTMPCSEIGYDCSSWEKKSHKNCIFFQKTVENV